MNQMQSAFINNNISANGFRKFYGKFRMPSVKPLIIKVDIKTNGRGGSMRGRSIIQRVSHITGLGENKRAVTTGGDCYKFEEEGNNVLRAIF